jgi:hypothetical protein
MLIGVLACACFLLQQFAVHLHMAWTDHVVAAGNGEHVHTLAADAHGAPGHRHDATDHSDADESDGEDESHPLDDHLVELASPVVAPSVVHYALALAPVATGLPAFDLPCRTRPGWADGVPRPPPPRCASIPRAPPVAL